MSTHDAHRGRDDSTRRLDVRTGYKFCPNCEIELLRDKNGFYCLKCNYYEQ